MQLASVDFGNAKSILCLIGVVLLVIWWFRGRGGPPKGGGKPDLFGE